MSDADLPCNATGTRQTRTASRRNTTCIDLMRSRVSAVGRTHSRPNIQASRAAQPNVKRFNVRRMIGAGHLWVSESHYFSDPFEPGPSRAQWVEQMD